MKFVRPITGRRRIMAITLKKATYQEYDIFNKTQPIESDFDKMVKGLSKAGK